MAIQGTAATKKKYRTKNRQKFAHYQRIHRYKKSGLHPPYAPPPACEACGTFFSRSAHGACLDHCHLTGLFRGWLCSKCNTALGMVGDDPAGVRRLLNYIEHAYTALSNRLTQEPKP